MHRKTREAAEVACHDAQNRKGGRKKKGEGRERRSRQGQKGHFGSVLSPRKQEMNILLPAVSISKFDNNDSVLQQTASFCMSASKEGHFECPVANFAINKILTTQTSKTGKH